MSRATLDRSLGRGRRGIEGKREGKNAMKNVLKRRPSAAMIIAIIALVVALGGTAVAAKKLGLGALSPTAKKKTVGVGKLTYVSTTKTIPGGGSPDGINVQVSATCPSGTHVIGGGIKVPEPAPGPNND